MSTPTGKPIRLTTTTKAPWRLVIEGHVVPGEDRVYASRAKVREARDHLIANPAEIEPLLTLVPIDVPEDWYPTTSTPRGPKAGKDPRDADAKAADEAKHKALREAQDKATAKAAEAKPAKAPKVNGRKAAAEKSPYSTAPVAGRIKRQGKSRVTGVQTQIEDGLHKDATFKIKGSGRYRVSCLDHKAHRDVPGMTQAKPLQSRTYLFCKKCDAATPADKRDKVNPLAEPNAA